MGRIYKDAKEDKVCELLKNKYLKNKSFASCKGDRGSQFWQDINKIKHKFKWGATFKVGNGKNTLFWVDIWIQDKPLYQTFPRLYACCRKKDALVGDYWVNGEWDIGFKRPFGQAELSEWESLMSMLEGAQLSHHIDQVIWRLEKSGDYTTKSMYRLLSFSGLNNRTVKKLWKNRMPLKLKIFLWLAFQDRLQSGATLKKRHWRGDERCIVCLVKEDANHILFGCVVAKFVWGCFKEALGWDRMPRNITDFLASWIPLRCQDYHLKLFQFAIVAWALWTNRNKMAIEHKFPASLTDVLHKIDFFSQKWRGLLPEKDRPGLETTRSSLMEWVRVHGVGTSRGELDAEI